MVWNICNIVLFRRIENLILFEIGWKLESLWGKNIFFRKPEKQLFFSSPYNLHKSVIGSQKELTSCFQTKKG